MNPASAVQPFDAFEASPDPSALLAADGALLAANGAFRAAFRHYVGPGRPPWGRVTPPAFVRDQRRFEAAAPDGRRFEWAERRLPGGGSFVAARDVSRFAAAAEESLRAKTVLFATLTHELRTPLNGILGMAGLLGQSELAPAQLSYVQAIRQSGEHLLELISEILDYSRLEAGRIELESAPFDPEATLQGVAELLSPKAHEKGVEIIPVMRSGAPARVLGDDGRLRQILFNLAGNAVKFTAEGGVVLECMPAGVQRLRFSVRDTGPGVPPEKQALIFEEFAQADASIARQHGGAGLGLAIVKKLTHALGGRLGLESRPGRGAHFWVELPLAAVEGGPPPPSLAGLRIALETPSPLLAETLGLVIAAMGGLMVGPEQKPDLLLLDHHAGLDAAAIAAAKARARALIVLIPQERREAIEEMRQLGAEHYALKPVRRDSLAERARLALTQEAPASAAPARRDERAPGPALEGVRVLLAEDNPINALLARTLLTRMGCLVDVVGDGEEAVAAAEAAPYDLIFLDLRMPRLDGVGAAQRIRALPGEAARAPIVALTADASEEDRQRALKAGMDDFVTKPIEPQRLLAVASRFTADAKTATL